MKIPVIKDALLLKTAVDSKRRSILDSTADSEEKQYPFDIQRAADAYTLNPYHNQAIDIKSMNILGQGFAEDFMHILDELTPEDSAYTLLLKTIRDIRTFGNAYWEIAKNVGSSHQVFHVPANTIFKTKKGWIQKIDDKTVEFSDGEIFQFAEFSFLSNVYGTPDYLPILDFIDLMTAIILYNKGFFSGNAIPEQLLVVKGATLSPKALSAVQRFFRRAFGGVENAHKMLYLPVPMEAEIELKRLQAEGKDGEYGKLFDQCVTAIIACHGVPPRLMSIMTPGSLGGSGETTGQLRIFYNTVIYPRQQMFIGDLQRLDKQYDNIFGAYDTTKLAFQNFETEDQAADAADFLRRI